MRNTQLPALQNLPQKGSPWVDEGIDGVDIMSGWRETAELLSFISAD